ncbi:hypothetical protein JVU11DRAFT_4403 [Chiua virens]|nr:hypothetical protein JVU11DRAFT_4403 [Chiua virens]
MFKFFQVLFLLAVVPCRVLAFPVSYTSKITANTYYASLAAIFISIASLAVAFLAVKFVYMKLRRIGTIHAPDDTHSSTRFRDKRGNGYRGVWVGCLGSPAWETHLTSKLDGVTPWRLRNHSRRSYHTGSTPMRSTYSSTRTKSRNSTANSRLTKSTVLTSFSCDADPLIVPSSSSARSRTWTASAHGGSSSKAFLPIQRNNSTHGHLCYGDFGESYRFRSPRGGVPKVQMRRASPSSIRLVDGPSHSNQVEYSFLSGLPPDTVMVSPLVGTRDSFQLSRCSLRCHRTPAPPLPPLPSFLPFHAPETLELRAQRESEYLPPLRFSPIASVIKAFHSQHLSEKKASGKQTLDHEESKKKLDMKVACMVSKRRISSSGSSKPQHANDTGSVTSSPIVQGAPPLLGHVVERLNPRSNHKRCRSQPCKGIGAAFPPTTLTVSEVSPALPPGSEDNGCGITQSKQTGVLRTSSGSSGNGSIASRKPLKSCLRQNSAVSTPLINTPNMTLTASISESSTRIWTMDTKRSTVDQTSIRTPLSEIDIGILGLNRFRWNDEIKELEVRASHMKKDSVALVPYWE